MNSEKIGKRLDELTASNKTNTTEYNYLLDQYKKVRGKEVKKWTSNWKKNSKKHSEKPSWQK